MHTILSASWALAGRAVMAGVRSVRLALSCAGALLVWVLSFAMRTRECESDSEGDAIGSGERSAMGKGQRRAAHMRRMHERLAQRGLALVPVAMDGNCQFGAVAHGVFGTPSLAGRLRVACVHYLWKHRVDLCPFVGSQNDAQFLAYSRRMLLDGEWGDHITLQSLADMLETRFVLVHGHATQEEQPIEPSHGRVARTVALAYTTGLHYDLALSQEELVARQANAISFVAWDEIMRGLPPVGADEGPLRARRATRGKVPERFH